MSGEEEDSEFYVSNVTPRKRSGFCVTSCRDDLDAIYRLVHVCVMALTNPEWKGQETCQLWVGGVLFDFVAPKVNQLSEDLKTI